MQMMGAFSEFERSLIRERQREGIVKAKKKGIKFGASPKLSESQILDIKARRDSGSSVIAIANEFEVSRQTIYSLLKNI